jgi:hypothetical protein
LSGDKGSPGKPGLRGDRGEAGAKGDYGVFGEPGEDGPPGDRGAKVRILLDISTKYKVQTSPQMSNEKDKEYKVAFVYYLTILIVKHIYIIN